jgi:NAD-dependent dihydropyrimidine dehydrogenase PreA subunit
MPFVVGAACIDVKDLGCLDVCPVDCIYEGGRTVYIHPTECIDCGLCESVCPVAAIHADDRLPDGEKRPAVTGWGSPGGADDDHVTGDDHPLVAAWPRRGGA